MKDAGGVHVGFFKGKDLIDYTDEHVFIVGPTRCGKDQSLLLKTLLGTWVGSGVHHDLKGEMYETCADYRSAFSYQCMFDPTNPKCIGINLFDWVFPGRPDDEPGLSPVVRQVQNIIHVLTEGEPGFRADHWIKASRGYSTAGGVHLLYAAKDRDKNIGGLRRFIASGDRGLYEMREASVDPICVQVAEEMLSFGGKTEDGEEMSKSGYRASVYNTAGAMLNLWDDPVIDRVTQRSEFDVTDIQCADAPMDLWLINRPSDSDRITPLLRAIIVMSRRALMYKEKVAFDGRIKNHRVLGNYNEFAMLGINDAAIAATFGASYGFKFVFSVQSIASLEKRHGLELINNTATRVFFRPNDDNEAERISKMVGNTRVTVENKSYSKRNGEIMGGSTTTAPREQVKAVLPADKLMAWEPRKKTVILGRGKPILSEIKMAYQDKRYVSRMKPPPPLRDENGAYIDAPGTPDVFVSPWLGRYVAPRPKPERKVEEPKKATRQRSNKGPAKPAVEAPNEEPIAEPVEEVVAL